MAGAGWYPDPGGSGQYRYWDGTRWSAQTNPTPTGPPPGSQGQQGRQQGTNQGEKQKGKGGLAAIIGALALIVVVAVIALAVTKPWANGNELTGDEPTPTVSGWNDGESTPPPATPSHSANNSPSATQPTPSDSDSGAPPPDSVTCPSGDPRARADHPNDDRVHGGGISFAQPGDYERGVGTSGMSFAYDVDTADFNVVSSWYSIFAVGALHADDGFGTDPKKAAGLVMQCVASSQWYDTITSTEPVHSKAVTVDGHAGWSVRIKVFCDYPTAPEVKGDVVDVTVVDTGVSGQLAVFMGQATIDDAHTLQAMEAVLGSLQVE